MSCSRKTSPQCMRYAIKFLPRPRTMNARSSNVTRVLCRQVLCGASPPLTAPMNTKTTVPLSFLAMTLMGFGVAAQEPTPKAPTPPQQEAQDMKGHDMSRLQEGAKQDGDARGHDMADMNKQSAGSMALHRVMAKGPDMPMPMSGDVDKDFAAMNVHASPAGHRNVERFAEARTRSRTEGARAAYEASTAEGDCGTRAVQAVSARSRRVP